MIAIDFGNLCFNAQASEQNIIFVAAPKKVYSSMDAFITEALNFLESDERFCDNWNEMYKNRTNLPASADDIAWMESRLEEMNQRVDILYGPAITCLLYTSPSPRDA